MRAQDHPEYDEERQHLQETVRFAQEEVKSWEDYNDVVLLKGAHNALAKSRIESIKRYKRVLQDPTSDEWTGMQPRATDQRPST